MAIDGTYLQGITTVVHDWTQINFNNFVYSAVYFTGIADGGGGGSSIINGDSVTIVVGVTLPLVIKEEGTILDNNFVLLGNPMPVFAENFSGVANAIAYNNKYSFFFNQNDKENFDCGLPPSFNNSSITVSIWAKPEDANPPQDGYMVDTYSVGDGFALIQDRDNTTPRWGFIVGITGSAGITKVIGTTVPVNDEWAHIVGVWDNDTGDLKIYVNGVHQNTDNHAPETLEDDGEVLRIGAGSAAGNEYNGFLNNCRIWYTALSDEEIEEVFNGGTPSESVPQENELIFWSELGNNATWNGAEWIIKDNEGNNNGISTATMEWDNRKVDTP